MNNDWLWDRKLTDADARNILRHQDSPNFIQTAALLLSRKNTPRDVFKDYLDPVVFCGRWQAIKRKMRQDSWSEPRIIFWQAVYENLIEKYRKKGLTFRKEIIAQDPLCAVVGKRIAALRQGQGKTQKEFAHKIGVSQQLVSRIEKGGENISLKTLKNIARALNVKIDINFLAAT
jgi:DNA-binding XRE family transcriptional regulator